MDGASESMTPDFGAGTEPSLGLERVQEEMEVAAFVAPEEGVFVWVGEEGVVVVEAGVGSAVGGGGSEGDEFVAGAAVVVAASVGEQDLARSV